MLAIRTMKTQSSIFSVLGLLCLLISPGEALGYNCVASRASANSWISAKEAYQLGLAAIEAGEYVQARDKFELALEIYPEFSLAQAKLAEGQTILDQQAQGVYAQASVLWSDNQPERAVILLEDVMNLLDDPDNELYQRAQAKRDSLSSE